jgi:hypothetical protein
LPTKAKIPIGCAVRYVTPEPFQSFPGTKPQRTIRYDKLAAHFL